MPSLIPGYEYDIFISYRQNDNRSGASAGSGQGWVTEFMKALQEELAATIKEPVSVYFDANPHDGLLETHNVDKSLEGKLKCLIFIPILSQTYCDPKSFAWQHEFCVFNGMAKEDKFGRDVKLSSGNVTSRILPIRIHDLDAEDKTIIENEIGGVLRAIEFIYKTPGVNRPLTLSDKKEDNANKTFYKDQLNKAANAIKEIIAALKNPAVQSTLINTNQQQLTKTTQSKTKFILAGIALLIAAALYFLYPKFISKTSPEEAIDKSVAVLPFADMSPNHDQEYFGDGVAEEIINVLAQAKDLKVISRSSSFQFKGKNEDLRKIGDQLGVATVLEGSVRKSNGTIRVTAQLIKVMDGSHLWSKTFDRTGDDALAIQDEIAKAVAKEFQTTLSIENAPKSRPWNEEAYRLYQKGRYLFDRVGYGEREKAHELFLQAAQKDSTLPKSRRGMRFF